MASVMLLLLGGVGLSWMFLEHAATSDKAWVGPWIALYFGTAYNMMLSKARFSRAREVYTLAQSTQGQRHL